MLRMFMLVSLALIGFAHAEEPITIRFGFATDTYDCEGQATSGPHAVTLDQQWLSAAVAAMQGDAVFVLGQLVPLAIQGKAMADAVDLPSLSAAARH